MVFSMLRRANGLPEEPPIDLRSKASWLTSLAGINGPQTIPLRIWRIGEALPPGAGVFLFASHSDRKWNCLFAGETLDLRSRVTAHEILPEALLLGATHIHAARVNDYQARQYIAERLIFMYGPELNASDAPTLVDLIAQGRPIPPEPEQPRLSVAAR